MAGPEWGTVCSMKNLAFVTVATILASCTSGPGIKAESPPALGAAYHSGYGIPRDPARRAQGGDADSDLAKKTQNPVSDLVSLPFQNNYQGDFGKDNDGRNTVNIQPVYPADMGDYLILNRPILPIIYQPAPVPGTDDEFGFGDLTYTAWYSPKGDPEEPLWGYGAVASIPTASDDLLGVDALGLGPSIVGVKMAGKWVFGGLAQNVWGVAGPDRNDLNVFLTQIFVNYNLSDGWFLTSAPIITANWEADSGDRWVVPVGGGFGKVFRWGMRPMNFSMQAFWYAESPAIGPEYEIRFQLAFLFPKKK